ncbi:MAG: hypothetical protein IKR68_02470 [Lachnospiraceae bacterium]|nr:hypothetical protein [Lachnospiraceae bacterium]
MGKQTYTKGSIIHPADSPVTTMEVILSGNVRITGAHVNLSLGAGSLVGAFEAPQTPYSYTYEAVEDTILFDYPYTKRGDIERVISSNPMIIPNMSSALMKFYLEAAQVYAALEKDAADMFRFIKETYDKYLDFCSEHKVAPLALSHSEDIKAFSSEETVPAWVAQHYSAMRALAPEVRKPLFSASPYTGIGLIMHCIFDTVILLDQIRGAIDYTSALGSYAISGDSGDFFDLFSNLLFQVSQKPYADTEAIETEVGKLIIYMTESSYVDSARMHESVSRYRKMLADIEAAAGDTTDSGVGKDAFEALDHSLDTILTYSEIDEGEAEEFKKLIAQYAAMSDKNSSDDAARKLRRAITERFYNIYEAAFFKSLTVTRFPNPVRMFFYFGYVDENLCGLNNAGVLYELLSSIKPDPEGRVMTIYEWLVSVYKGENEPSKNEFDMDYPAYLKDQKNNGYLSAEQEKKLLKDQRSKVSFEIKNFFSIGNRVTFGRITTFCPVLSEHNILRPLRSIYLTPQKVKEAIDEVRNVDFTCFYRDVLFSNPKIGINQEYVAKEVLPHVILMPNVGSRGSLWQEIAGIKRDTPGRITLSIFPTENLSDMVLRLAGEFRWELCKRIQGIRWNDVTDPSLTSEYCDYLQFFKKNRDLSVEHKEKLKLQLQRAKNNYREAFVMDYMQWVKYESTGSPRLNKVARAMMVRYVPFTSAVFTSLYTNPMFKEPIDKRKLKLSQRLHTLNVLVQKLQSQGIPVPEEISGEIAHLNK